MSDNIIKILPTELDGNSRYAIRVRTINSFGTVSEWSDSIIADTYDAGTSTGGKLVLTANGMIAYDPNGQTSLVYSGTNTASRTNFVVNPSFEINTNGWTALTLSSISRITTDFYVGEPAYKACLRVASSGATLKDVGFITAAANRTFSTSGRVYTASAYVKALVSQVSIKIGIVFYNTAGVVIKTVYSYSPRIVNADGLWARVSIIGTQAPNATASIGIILASASAMTAGQAFLVDGVLGERSSTLGDYFDGSTSLGATKWNGTAHFSTSIFDFSSPYFVDGGVFTAGTLQTAVDVGAPQAASPYYGKAGVKMSTSGVQGYSGLQATPSFSLATDGKFRVGNLSNYMYWDGSNLTLETAGRFRVGGASSYMLWDGTNLIITGNVSGGTIDIGGFDSTSFHVDATGQMWLGAGAYASAPFKVSATGTLTVSGGSIDGGAITGSTITGGTVQTATSGKRITLSGTAFTFIGTADGIPPKIVFNTGGVLSTGAGIDCDANLLINCSYGTLNVGKVGGVGSEGNYYYGLSVHDFSVAAGSGGSALLIKSNVVTVQSTWPLRFVSDGTISAPIISWTTDTDTGIRRRNADDMALVAGGVDNVVCTSGVVYVTLAANGGETASVRYDGFSGLHVQASNRDLKDNIKEFPSATALKIVNELKPKSFTWKPLETDTETQALLRPFNPSIGFIAEEVAEIGKDEGINFAEYKIPSNFDDIEDLLKWEVFYWKEPHFIALLVGAVQELTQKIKALEAKIAVLEK